MKKGSRTNRPILLALKAGTYFWCTCGKTSTPPFCNGSHNGLNEKPLKKVISSETKVSWCNCGITNDAPFCDGSHKKLQDEEDQELGDLIF